MKGFTIMVSHFLLNNVICPSVVAARCNKLRIYLVLLCILAPVFSTIKAQVEVTITSDNAYQIGFGTIDEITQLFTERVNCSAAAIYNCTINGTPDNGPEQYTLQNVSLTNYVYIIAFSDESDYQGLLAEFTQGSTTLLSGAGTAIPWEVYATGVQRGPIGVSCPTLTPLTIEEINDQIDIAKSPLGGPVATSSVHWVRATPHATDVGVIAFGPDNDANTPNSFGLFPPAILTCIKSAAQWMWYNPNPTAITNPFIAGPHPNFPSAETREYYIFRVGPLNRVFGCDEVDRTGRICGKKWSDANSDKKFSYSSEAGIPNWQMYLKHCDENGEPIGPILATATTDANGFYCFDSLCPGDYCIVEETRFGWDPTWPIKIEVIHFSYTFMGIEYKTDYAIEKSVPYQHVHVDVGESVMGVDFGNKYNGIIVNHRDDKTIVLKKSTDGGTSWVDVGSGINFRLGGFIPGLYSISRKQVANYTFGPVYVNDSLVGDGSVDSVVVDFTDSTQGFTIIFESIYQPDSTLTFRTFTAEQFADSIQNAKPQVRKNVNMPKMANLFDEIFKEKVKPKRTVTAGLPKQLFVTTEKGYLNPTSQSNLYKTFAIKNKAHARVTHSGTPRGLDYFDGTEKRIMKKQKTMQPDKHNNSFLANLLALKLNLLASSAGRTPTGFGNLIVKDCFASCQEASQTVADSLREIYLNSCITDCPFTPARIYSVSKLASLADSMLTNWEGRSYEQYEHINALMNALNASFADSLPFGVEDTVSWINNKKLILSGAKPLSEVTFLLQATDFSVIASSQEQSFENTMPSTYDLLQNYPNPFNPMTSIQFALPEPAIVTLTVYNMLGQEVVRLAEHEQYGEGVQEIMFDANSLSSGVYFYRLMVETTNENGNVNKTFTDMKKMLLMK